MDAFSLEGIRVVELTMYLQGPIAGRVLGELGAEVIRIESPIVDPARGLRAPADASPDSKAPTNPSMNRNKRSLTLDLKKPSGVEILHKLVACSDVFLTNLRNSSLEQ